MEVAWLLLFAVAAAACAGAAHWWPSIARRTNASAEIALGRVLERLATATSASPGTGGGAPPLIVASTPQESPRGRTTAGEAVFVFAHPDDEAMFFTPTLRHLSRSGRGVHLLCFSTGNYAGLGNVRSQEMHRSGAIYGAASVTVVDDRRTQDGPGKWDVGFVASYLHQYLSDRPQIKLIFTFDAAGVSSHPNHIDVHHGVRRFMSSPASQSSVAAFQLRTSRFLIKYSGLLEVLWWGLTGSSAERPYRFLVDRDEMLFSLTGMRAHASQLVWFRYLFVFASQYGFVNEWSEMMMMMIGSSALSGGGTSTGP